MKYNTVKVMVLLSSVAGMSYFVWKSSQRETVKDPEPSKSASTEVVKKSSVTDEEVKAARAAMMLSSKSGIIMSEEETRKMLEERLEQKNKSAPKPQDLAPSSKVMRVIDPEELKELKRQDIEQKVNQPPR